VIVGLAVIFLTGTVQDYLSTEGKLTPSRHTWLRVALIFAGVGVILALLRRGVALKAESIQTQKVGLGLVIRPLRFALSRAIQRCADLSTS
jgi:hypothetical protein